MKQLASQADPRAIIALIAMGAAFGASFLFMKVLSDEIATFEIVAGRLILGAAVLAAFVMLRNKPLLMTGGNLAQIGALAIFESIVPFSLVAWAETRIEAGMASLLISTMPVFTVIVAMFFLPDERRAPVRLVALPLGLAGVVVLSGGDILRFGGDNAAGQLAVIGAAGSYAAGTVHTKFLLRTNDPINLAGTKLVMAAAMAVALTAATNGSPDIGALSVGGWLSLAGIGLIATAGAFTIYVWLVSRAGSVFASMVTYVTPVFGVLFGWAILGEGVGPETAAGAALIAAAIGSVMYGPALAETAAGWLSGRQILPSPEGIQLSVQRAAPVICQEDYA